MSTPTTTPRVLTDEEAGFSEEQLAKIATASEHKERADAAFKAGDAKAALASYHYAIMYIKGIDKSPAATSSAMSGNKDDKDKPITSVDVMQEKIYGNMSSAHLKLGNWQRALDTAEQCLRKNAHNHKARFKKAKALGEIGFYERAEPILLDLLKQTPAEAPSINAEMARLKAMDKEREKISKQKLKGWMKRDKGSPPPPDAKKAAGGEDEGFTSAGPPPGVSATIEEIP